MYLGWVGEGCSWGGWVGEGCSWGGWVGEGCSWGEKRFAAMFEILFEWFKKGYVWKKEEFAG